MFENIVTNARLDWRATPELLSGWEDVRAKEFKIFYLPGLNFACQKELTNIYVTTK